MDAETIRNITSALMGLGIFFLMMRYGCGSHMMHGHRHGDHQHGETTGGDAKDPVCGMTVDPKNAAAATVKGGSTYYFCSASRRDSFEKEPDKFLHGTTTMPHAETSRHSGAA